MLARTRSTRLFVVLLHLVGVSTDLEPSSSGGFRPFWNDAGIMGVNPASILLEISDPSKQGLNNLQPHWLQDAQDQNCLGPMGTFSACGDASLWRVIPLAKRHARRRQFIRWATEDDDVDGDAPQGYALQVFDGTINFYGDKATRRLPSETPSKSSRKSGLGLTGEDFSDKECLTRRRKDKRLVMVPCSEDRAWFWKVNELGILHFDKPSRGGSSRKGSNQRKLLNKRQSLECVWRNATEAVLLSCDGRHLSHHANTTIVDDGARVVQIQFVRQVSQSDVVATKYVPPRDATKVPKKNYDFREENSDSESARGNANRETDASEEIVNKRSPLPYAFGNLPSQVDKAHSQISAASLHTEPRVGSRITSILPQRTSEAVSKQLPRFLGDTNPILVASSNRNVGGAVRIQAPKKRSHTEENLSAQPSPSSSVLHDLSSSHATKPTVRKIQSNPYIVASVDERWMDPQTGLVYKTDLCQYLGHERMDVGRHTLTGVGQYTKTMLKIKVRFRVSWRSLFNGAKRGILCFLHFFKPFQFCLSCGSHARSME
jgi:hypothetical protein